jgi:hypothetical protein
MQMIFVKEISYIWSIKYSKYFLLFFEKCKLKCKDFSADIWVVHCNLYDVKHKKCVSTYLLFKSSCAISVNYIIM